jgi:hypothetical protein
MNVAYIRVKVNIRKFETVHCLNQDKNYQTLHTVGLGKAQHRLVQRLHRLDLGKKYPSTRYTARPITAMDVNIATTITHIVT